MKPSIGRIVDVGTPNGFNRKLFNAAIVVSANGTRVNVQMFLDHNGGYVYMRDLPMRCEAAALDLCWRWPERVP